jgi:hypothetical protein
MSPRHRRSAIVAASALIAFYAGTTLAYAIPRTPEQDTLAIAKQLRPIPDSEWAQIAGTHASEEYTIVHGDTLYDISKRLFGDAKYWPKIWALNNQHITNPHLIRPGRTIAFLPGSGSSLPAVAIRDQSQADGEPRSPDAIRDAAAAASPSPEPSQEWKLLPRQAWEKINVPLPPEVDAQGFDSRSKIVRSHPDGFELPVIVTSEEIKPLGVVKAARVASEFLTLGDSVYIESKGQLEVGETYAVVGEPAELNPKHSDRTGYSYLINGKVRIRGVKDGLYFGTIVTSNFVITRDQYLIPLIPRIHDMKPIPAPGTIDAEVSIASASRAGRRLSTSSSSSTEGPRTAWPPGWCSGLISISTRAPRKRSPETTSSPSPTSRRSMSRIDSA